MSQHSLSQSPCTHVPQWDTLKIREAASAFIPPLQMTTIKISDDAFNAAMSERKPAAKRARKSPHPALIAVGVIAGLTFLGNLIPDPEPKTTPAVEVSAKPVVNQAEVERLLVKRCVDELKAELKAPDSYQQKGAYAVSSEDGSSVLVGIEYSAINSFNARLTDNKICHYVD